MKAEIQEYDEGRPCLYVEIGGHGYNFSIKGFPRDSHDWLKGVISRNMDAVYQRAKQEERTRMQEDFKKLLGL